MDGGNHFTQRGNQYTSLELGKGWDYIPGYGYLHVADTAALKARITGVPGFAAGIGLFYEVDSGLTYYNSGTKLISAWTVWVKP